MADNEVATVDKGKSAFGVGALVASTVDATTNDGKLAIAGALNGALSLSSMEGKKITVVDVLMREGVRKGRDGAPDKPCIDTWIIDRDGKAFFTKSEGVARSLENILTLWPDLNKPDGVTVLFKTTILANGNSYKTLTPVKA